MWHDDLGMTQEEIADQMGLKAVSVVSEKLTMWKQHLAGKIAPTVEADLSKSKGFSFERSKENSGVPELPDEPEKPSMPSDKGVEAGKPIRDVGGRPRKPGRPLKKGEKKQAGKKEHHDTRHMEASPSPCSKSSEISPCSSPSFPASFNTLDLARGTNPFRAKCSAAFLISENS